MSMNNTMILSRGSDSQNAIVFLQIGPQSHLSMIAAATPPDYRFEEPSDDATTQQQSSPLHESSSLAVASSVQDGHGCHGAHAHRRPYLRPRPRRHCNWKSRKAPVVHCMSLLVLLAAQATTTTTNAKFIKVSSSSKCIDQWHVSTEHPRTCTNSVVFPPSWASSSEIDDLFHDTARGCCQNVMASSSSASSSASSVGGQCDTINACDVADNYYDDAEQDIQDYLNDPNGESKSAAGAPSLCGKTTWHMSTKVLNACTNDGVYPVAWNRPRQAKDRLFDSGKECCEGIYPRQGCDVIDICSKTPPPTSQRASRPTRPPRTRKPGPTKKPTSEPTTTRRPTVDPTKTPPNWFVDRTSSQCVMDCVNEPGRPCKGNKGDWEDSFATVEECCDSISWIPSDECVATASPTKTKTEAPEGKGVRFDWYRVQSTNVCVLDCENEPGYPCGGRATKWDMRYASVEECCASVSWKPFEDCASTASPVTASPTTPVPTLVPTALSEREMQPSANPTTRPTFDCSAPRQWYLFRNGETSTCVNDETYSDDTLTPSMAFYLTFGRAEQCCYSPFARGNCRVIDICANNTVRWYGDYSRGWDDGVCVNTDRAPIVPKGRRTYTDEHECCSEGFFGQSSEACLSNAA